MGFRCPTVFRIFFYLARSSFIQVNGELKAIIHFLNRLSGFCYVPPIPGGMGRRTE